MFIPDVQSFKWSKHYYFPPQQISVDIATKINLSTLIAVIFSMFGIVVLVIIRKVLVAKL